MEALLRLLSEASPAVAVLAIAYFVIRANSRVTQTQADNMGLVIALAQHIVISSQAIERALERHDTDSESARGRMQGVATQLEAGIARLEAMLGELPEEVEAALHDDLAAVVAELGQLAGAIDTHARQTQEDNQALRQRFEESIAHLMTLLEPRNTLEHRTQ